MWFTPRDHRIVGEALAKVRKGAGVTQLELAERLKKPQSFVSSYESGQRRLDLLEMVKVITAIGADPKRVCAELVERLVRRRGSHR